MRFGSRLLLLHLNRWTTATAQENNVVVLSFTLIVVTSLISILN